MCGTNISHSHCLHQFNQMYQRRIMLCNVYLCACVIVFDLNFLHCKSTVLVFLWLLSVVVYRQKWYIYTLPELCQWLHYASKAFCYQNIAWNLFEVPNYRIRNVENFNQTRHIYTYLRININFVLFKSACAFVNGQYMWNKVYLFHHTTRFLPKNKIKNRKYR